MTRDQGIRMLAARPNGAQYRFLELLCSGALHSVRIERVDKPAWSVTGKDWADALRQLAIEDG